MKLSKLHPSYVLSHPDRIWPFLRHRLGRAAAPLYVGRKYRCTLCGRHLRTWARIFTSEHAGPSDGVCPFCSSHPRTRQLWRWLQNEGGVGPGRQVLHCAPEPALEGALRRKTLARVTTTDLERDDVDLRADLTALPLPEARFDLILCSHVLEHIPDDAAAMSELLRVLKPGGRALIQVPLGPGPTEEDPSASPEERDRRFGQADHVRTYGPDITGRLERAGFAVETVELPAALSLSEAELKEEGIAQPDVLFVARRA